MSDENAPYTIGQIWLDENGNAYDDEARTRRIGSIIDSAMMGNSLYWKEGIRCTETTAPVHRHDWQLRIINYRVMAECACGETMDEDEIRSAL
jgi:hypothetical protein